MKRRADRPLRAYNIGSTMKRTILFSLVLGAVSIFAAETGAQQIDPNVNTQQQNARSSGSNGNPGFNPCSGGTRGAGGVCSAVTGSLLSSTNLTTRFPSLGPGAVTDNMFGRISGADELGTPTTECGTVSSGNTLSGLNCGNLRFNPIEQGQAIPTGTGTNNLITPPSGVDMNQQFVADFCPGPGPAVTDCSDESGAPGPNQKVAAHAGFSIVDQFKFTVINGTNSSVASIQDIRQVTALKQTGIGTLGSPGTGDQVFSIHTDWTTSATAGPGASPTSPTGQPTGLTVNWSQSIVDPDQSGTGTGAFTQTIAGTFIKNTGTFDPVQYPNGETQTNGNTSPSIP